MTHQPRIDSVIHGGIFNFSTPTTFKGAVFHGCVWGNSVIIGGFGSEIFQNTKNLGYVKTWVKVLSVLRSWESLTNFNYSVERNRIFYRSSENFAFLYTAHLIKLHYGGDAGKSGKCRSHEMFYINYSILILNY